MFLFFQLYIVREKLIKNFATSIYKKCLFYNKNVRRPFVWLTHEYCMIRYFLLSYAMSIA